MMDKISNVDVNITEIKYDIATNSLLIDLSDRPRWTIPCKNVVCLEERIEDVAPYFLCFFLDRLEEEGYEILKRIKVFTVFIEHEGVLHLRKYDNLIKKIKAGRLKEGAVARKVALVDDQGAIDGDEAAEALLEILRNAGLEVDVVKTKKKITLAELKNDGDGVISLHPLDILAPKKFHGEDAAITANGNAIRVPNGETEHEKHDTPVHATPKAGGNGKEECHLNGHVMAEANATNEKKQEVQIFPSESSEPKLNPEDENADDAGKTHIDHVGTVVEEIGPKTSMNGSASGNEAVNKGEKHSRSGAAKRKRSRDQKRGDDVKKSDNAEKLALSETLSPPSSGWHWSYYLIPAALIALLAISVHLFRDKTRTNGA